MNKSQQNQDQDKRKFPRISRNIDIEISQLTFPLADAVIKKGTSIDIGGNGIRFTSSEPYEPKAILNLKINIIGWEGFKKPFSKFIDLSSDAFLGVVGEVVWCNENVEDGENGENGENGDYELGIKFLNVYEDDYNALMRYLKADSKSD
ncbi:PilZ domain-containing protein [Desulfococcaceae bacterium HSG7]|nr:PilZ domain-containing protein [Desulfococcaceae bacterium HSG7]